MEEKVYLGDSVYASSDGFHIVLTTENGVGASNTIFLDDSVYLNLKKYGAKVFSHLEKKESGDE